MGRICLKEECPYRILDTCQRKTQEPLIGSVGGSIASKSWLHKESTEMIFKNKYSHFTSSLSESGIQRGDQGILLLKLILGQLLNQTVQTLY